MRVLLITGSFPPMMCPTGDYTRQLARALGETQGINVAVLTSTSAAAEESCGPYTLFPIVHSWDLTEAPAVLSAVRSWKPDLVHIQFPGVGFSRKLLPAILPLMLRATGFAVAQTWHFSFGLSKALRAMPLRLMSLLVVPGSLFVVNDNYRKRTLRWLFLHKLIRQIPTGSALPAVSLDPDRKREYRERYARSAPKMIAYFGFIFPSKGVHRLFEIADSEDSHIVIVGGLFREEEIKVIPRKWRREQVLYQDMIARQGQSERWKGKVTVTGFLPPEEAAGVLAAADAVVLPFLEGKNASNTSVYAAQAQGTFVLTTSKELRGYCEEENTFYASPEDIEAMRRALKQFSGKRALQAHAPERAWQSIRDTHLELYRRQLLAKAR